ncbi:cyclin-dependent kinase G-2-like isoform X1 [Cynara cardunculus var. scolymus]|uniref:cyclin-dependent kinase n=1 Tax=Cynara cardunculus var. scolymus TaxID=59895 RepID=A0A118K3C6_CYNCS|nr:cyclin-dependent kinase G-2-like isoform X1 [Cynara cardunculus var. scolymus]KVI05763.1 Protein kinase, catalytic domain-containing protein [Cynara cardunculus var. scolymus]
MNKYMAAGRHGGYRDNEFRERESDLDVSKREFSYSKGEYDRVRNGGNGAYERGKNRARDSRGGGRLRQKDIKERELVNGGGYRSASSRSYSGGSGEGGDSRHGDYHLRVGDREPGELSSESGSDEAVDSEIHGKSNEGSKMDNSSQSSLYSKKRKFSPIVWDRDDKEAGNSSMTRSSPANTTLPPPPPVPKSHRRSPNFVPAAVVQNFPVESNKLHSAHQSPGNTPIDIGKHDSSGFETHVGLSSSPVQEEHVGLSSSPAQEEHAVYIQDVVQPEDVDYLPTRTIRSSRWANDANSPADEGELSDASGDNRIQQRTGSVEIRLQKQSSSPEVEEHHQEGTEVIRGRSSDSNEGGYRVRSSSVEDFPDNDLGRKDYMEIDNEHKKDGASLSLSESDSENGDGSPGTPEPAGPPQRCFNMLQGCRSVDEFERLNKIDEGTYGVVYRAKDKKTGEIVALKKVKMEKEREGFPLTSLREINILLSFHHPSIVDVKEVVVGSNLDSIFMVMEYMEHDLKALMETMKQPFSQSEVKCLMLQLLEGTKYLHDNWVLHRDLKTSNLLLNNRGELKICDFGLARQYGSPLKPYTHLVVTLWYRAPELLLGAKEYSTAIDMWSLGCIMAELLSKQPLFNGKTEFDQLDKIFKTLGTPNETIWPGYSKLPGVKVNFVKHQYNLLRRKFPATSFTGSPVLSDAGFDLLNKLITYDPKKRITAEEALNHEWFREVPLPKSKDFMPTFPAQHAQDRRTRRVMKSPDPLEEQRRKELQQAEFGTGGLFG